MSKFFTSTSGTKRRFSPGPTGRGGQNGIALITILVLLVMLTLLAVNGLRTSVLEEQISGNQKLSARALFGAEQGISEALEDLFDGTITSANLSPNPDGTVSGTGYSASYDVSLLTTADGSQVEDDDGRTYYLVTSTGTSGGSARRMLEVAVAMEMGGDANVAGLIGCQGVSAMSNVVTGSYSSSGQSSDGDRGDVATTDAGAFMYFDGGSDFDVNGEVRSTGALYLGGDALVRRDALAPVQIKTESNAHIYGSAWTNGNFSGRSGSVSGDINQGNTVVPDPVVPPVDCDPWDIDAIFTDAAGIKTNNDNGEISKSSGADFTGSPAELGVHGAAKDYYFSNFTLEGNETVTVYGDVRIYVRNDFTMKSDPRLVLASGATLKIYVEAGQFWVDSNAQLNVGGIPANLQVFSLKEDTVKDNKDWRNDEPDVWDDSQDIAGVKIDSNSIFYGMIYAPRSHVVLYSNAQIYGSARGRYVTTDSNLDFMYDEDLDDLWEGLPTDYKLVYWSELYPE